MFGRVCPHKQIQSNLSTTVGHGELKKWPLLTGDEKRQRKANLSPVFATLTVTQSSFVKPKRRSSYPT